MARKRTLNQHIMIEAAKRYAAANASDPFAYARAMTHIGNGIAVYADREGKPSYYDAELDTETRYLPTANGGMGEAYQATVYKNVARV